ncbi:MAG: carbohydrate ABC transporter permease [Saccharofermentanales bacterium]
MNKNIYLIKEMFHRTLSGKKSWYGLLFVAPWIIGALVFMLYPFFYSLLVSVNKIVNVTEFKLEWAGLFYYKAAIFDDVNFIPVFLKSSATNLINLPLINVFALIIAILLNKKIKGRGLFRALFFLPVILGTGFIMQQLLGQNVDEESMNFARGLLLPDQVRVYIGPSGTQFVLAFLSRITVVMWSSGVQIIIYLSGLQGISTTLYEAARVDSATEWESFWLITLPMLVPIIQLNLIYTVIDNFAGADNPIIKMIMFVAFKSGEPSFEFSSAVSWIYCIFIFMVIGAIFALTYKFVNNVKERI